jgi:methyl-accepting chemotaxis protein
MRFFRRRSDSPARPPASSASLENEVDESVGAMSIVSEQVSGVSAQVEEAVLELCTSFQDISKRAQESVGEARAVLGDGQAAGLEHAIGGARATFDRVLASMREISQRSLQAIENIDRVMIGIDKIESTLLEVENIAGSTRLLTVNAKIQASHSGVTGRGFVVIAEEIGELSNRSERIVEAIRSSLAEVMQAMSDASGQLVSSSQADMESSAAIREEIEGTLHTIASAHGRTKAGLERASQSGSDLAEAIHRVVGAMQFQDRVSQRLEHVIGSLTTISRRLVSVRSGQAVEGPGTLATMQSRFTMAEEHDLVAKNDAAGEAEAGGVTLF